MSSIAQEFLALFRGSKEIYGRSEVGTDVSEKGKRDAKSWTEKGEPNESAWAEHLQGTRGLGIAPLIRGTDSAFICFGAIDIDDYTVDAKHVENLVKDAGFPLVTCLTKSGGVHLYLFGDELEAETARHKLHEWAAYLGFPGIEVFPKQFTFGSEDDYGNWINMPYFGGERTTRYAIKDGKPLSPDQFVEHAKSMRITREQLDQVKTPVADDMFVEAPICIESMVRSGIAEGYRNRALFAFAVFLKKAYPDNWEEELDKVNQKYVSPPLGHKEVSNIVKSLNKKDYQYTCREAPLQNLCNRELCLKRKFGVGCGGGDPGITLTTMTKIDTTPPTWLIGINGQVVAMSTEDLMSQVRFQRRVIESLNLWPRTIKGPQWHRLIQERLQTAEVQEAPQDASIEGQILLYLEDYCYSRAQGKSKDDLLSGLAWTHDGRTYFRSTDFMRYLEQNRAMKLPQHEIWKVFRQQGAEHTKMTIKGKQGRYWSMPIMSQQTEEFDEPDMKEVTDF